MADTFIAKEQLFVNGIALAHNPGAEVSAEDVERNGWQDQVVKAGTKAAEKVVGEPQA
jgi:EAL domain-containing protein (putative c-di-GMP-specific phosphodiesterase class I)